MLGQIVSRWLRIPKGHGLQGTGREIGAHTRLRFETSCPIASVLCLRCGSDLSYPTPPIPHSAMGRPSCKPVSIWENIGCRKTNCLSCGNGTEKMACQFLSYRTVPWGYNKIRVKHHLLVFCRASAASGVFTISCAGITFRSSFIYAAAVAAA